MSNRIVPSPEDLGQKRESDSSSGTAAAGGVESNNASPLSSTRKADDDRVVLSTIRSQSSMKSIESKKSENGEPLANGNSNGEAIVVSVNTNSNHSGGKIEKSDSSTLKKIGNGALAKLHAIGSSSRSLKGNSENGEGGGGGGILGGMRLRKSAQVVPVTGDEANDQPLPSARSEGGGGAGHGQGKRPLGTRAHRRASAVSITPNSTLLSPTISGGLDSARRMMEQQQPKISLLRKWKTEPLIGSGTEADAEQRAFNCLMLLSTLFALWGTDIYELIGPPPIARDPILYTIVLMVFFCFMLELVFYTLFKPAYFLSFFFFLDAIATLSLLPDVLMLWNIEVFAEGEDASAQGIAVARAAQPAARAGTRAARVVRLFKLFSLLRRQDNKEDGEKRKRGEEGSKIGAVLTARTTQKVIVIVALMLISSQLLDIIGQAPVFAKFESNVAGRLEPLEALYFDAQMNKTAQSAALFSVLVSDFINDLNGDTVDALSPYDSILIDNCPTVTPSHIYNRTSLYFDTGNCNVRYLKISNEELFGSLDSANDLRSTPAEKAKYHSDSGQSSIVMQVVGSAQSTALSNILLILFVALLLGVSQLLFNRDSTRLVIAPLETMASFVRHLQKNPLHPMKLSAEAKKKLEAETKLVVDSMMKLSAMLQVGFGDAGASVIQQNMLNKSNQINPIVPGKRIQGIYVFCDIRNFTDCTECLQIDVMVFVNKIAQIVHQAVVDNHGAPNKNIGDAFLLVWSLPEKKFGHKDDEDPKKKIQYGDRALEAVIRIIIETAHEPSLTELTNRPAVQNRIPGYSTRMGFGLHLGWGIEGAIGSLLKIDATYLSPNVNMAGRLEGATKQYGIGILMTEFLYDVLSPDVQMLCRRIDRVTARGSNVPFDLYTYDAPKRADMETLVQGTDVWSRFPPTTSEEFRDMFEEAVKFYIGGNWEEASVRLRECSEMYPEDGPTRFLIQYIGQHSNIAPPSWIGFRRDGVD